MHEHDSISDVVERAEVKIMKLSDSHRHSFPLGWLNKCQCSGDDDDVCVRPGIGSSTALTVMNQHCCMASPMCIGA